jgi:hypothetical protein
MEENIEINCKYCGKPISKTSDFGMDCENDCARKKWEKDNGKPFNLDDEMNKIFNIPEVKNLMNKFHK